MGDDFGHLAPYNHHPKDQKWQHVGYASMPVNEKWGDIKSPGLVRLYSTVTGQSVNPPRDAHLFKNLMDQHYWTPVQVAAGLIRYAYERQIGDTIWTFARKADDFVPVDPLVAAVEFASVVAGDPVPGDLDHYLDCVYASDSCARLESLYERVKNRLEEWSNERLNATASLRNRSRLTKQFAERKITVT